MILLEDGTSLLAEDGSHLLLENGSDDLIGGRLNLGLGIGL